MPQIMQDFTVDQPVDVVWNFFQDVPQVAACMPGVELLDTVADNAYKGRLKVKLGPINAKFEGEAKIENLSEAGRTGTISAKGADRQGGSRASAKVNYSLTSAVDTGTKVEVVADITLQGAMAQFGRTGLINEVSAQMTKEFADCLKEKLGAATPEQAAAVSSREVKGFAVFFRGLWGWFKSLFRRTKD